MVEREINPLESRHMALTARFKSAWAFHQLLVGMQRMNSLVDFENKSAAFQSLYGRLKQLAESFHGPLVGADDLSPQMLELDQELSRLVQALEDHDDSVGPSDLRRFFQQVRTFDERLLVEVIRFYLEAQKGIKWEEGRLDKVDFLISRLAESVAGPRLQGDRTRLSKVLLAISSSPEEIGMRDDELRSLSSTLQDLRSEVRWVKTFEELSESQSVQIYRALKHDMGAKMFHPELLPIVIDVNGAFKRRVEELRGQEEARILDEYKELSQLQMEATPVTGELGQELNDLQSRIEEFRQRAKDDNVRLDELIDLGQALREFGGRIEAQPRIQQVDMAPRVASAPLPSNGVSDGAATSALMPDLSLLQPHWSDLWSGLSGLNPATSFEDASASGSLVSFRLEDREILAFQRLVGSDRSDKSLEQFLLAAAALRRRICKDVEEVRGMLSEAAGSIPEVTLRQARDTTRIADAYSKHFSHLIDQAVFDGFGEVARSYQALQTRLVRELSGLSILVPRLSSQVSSTSALAEAVAESVQPVGVLDDHEAQTDSDEPG